MSVSYKEAVTIFSSPKKALKYLDKVLSNERYEYILKANNKDSFAVYSSESNNPICVANDVLKVLEGVLFFEFGVGKQDLLPSWAMPSGFIEEKWQQLCKDVETDSASIFSSLNTALNIGSTLYCSNLQNSKPSFVLTNPFNENYADKIVINSSSFSDGLVQCESMANFCLTHCEDTCQ